LPSAIAGGGNRYLFNATSFDGSSVTPATSISFFRPEFDDFLYASIGADAGEMPLSVLSALARLDVDPWTEAAELSELPKGTATQRLAALIARLPGGRWTLADSTAIADRLVELLPNPSSSAVPLGPKKAFVLREMTGSAIAKILFCAVLGITALIIAANRQSSSQDNRSDAPAFSTASPPQTSRPISR
jgi:hypothetical protein